MLFLLLIAAAVATVYLPSAIYNVNEVLGSKENVALPEWNFCSKTAEEDIFDDKVTQLHFDTLPTLTNTRCSSITFRFAYQTLFLSENFPFTTKMFLYAGRSADQNSNRDDVYLNVDTNDHTCPFAAFDCVPFSVNVTRSRQETGIVYFEVALDCDVVTGGKTVIEVSCFPPFAGWIWAFEHQINITYEEVPTTTTAALTSSTSSTSAVSLSTSTSTQSETTVLQSRSTTTSPQQQSSQSTSTTTSPQQPSSQPTSTAALPTTTTNQQMTTTHERIIFVTVPPSAPPLSIGVIVGISVGIVSMLIFAAACFISIKRRGGARMQPL
jgi:hypothetical protein